MCIDSNVFIFHFAERVFLQYTDLEKIRRRRLIGLSDQNTVQRSVPFSNLKLTVGGVDNCIFSVVARGLR